MNNLNVDYRFSVAPMMGVTTPSARYMYRLISKEASFEIRRYMYLALGVVTPIIGATEKR